MKALLEDIFDRTSIKPTARTNIAGKEVYIADGFVAHEDLGIIQKHFSNVMEYGKEGRDRWPNGCYATIWITPGKIAYSGGISLSDNHSQGARISDIKQRAQESLNKQLH